VCYIGSGKYVLLVNVSYVTQQLHSNHSASKYLFMYVSVARSNEVPIPNEPKIVCIAQRLTVN